MKLVAVSQRVDVAGRYGERRDALDQRWIQFLRQCGLLPFPVPNEPSAVPALLSGLRVAGVVLTGGNDLVAYGGDAPERDATEVALIEWALHTGHPLAGVCRGMHVLQHYHGVKLEPVTGHIAVQQSITVRGRRVTANSYHRFGATTSVPELEVWASADDGVVKAVRHTNRPIVAVMWHPERFDPFRAEDVALFRGHFGCGTRG